MTKHSPYRYMTDGQATLSWLHRHDHEDKPPSPEQIEARRAELLQYAEGMREGFPAPIIVRGRITHYCIIHNGRVVGRTTHPPSEGVSSDDHCML